MLNGIYYKSETGDCYTTSSSPNVCDFNTGIDLPKGLDKTARGMIDNNVTWNLGGWNDSKITSSQFYEKERITPSSDENNHPSEWSTETDVGEKHNGIGLIYPSDYGYATNGGNIGRNACFTETLYNWNNDDGNYKSDCAGTNWIKPGTRFTWTLTSITNSNITAFYVHSNGIISWDSVNGDYGSIYPTAYLKSSVKMLSNNNLETYGSIDNPFNLAN